MDAAARYFRRSFARLGTFLQLEFAGAADPYSWGIRDLVRSDYASGDFDSSGVGSRPPPVVTPKGGAYFHTHPDIRHSSPGFGGDDLNTAMNSDAAAYYVFYDYTTYAAKKLNVDAAKGAHARPDRSEIYRYVSDFK